MVSPPKCKTCGKTEWRHLCGRLPDTFPGPDVGPKSKIKISRPAFAPNTEPVRPLALRPKPILADGLPICPTCNGTGHVNDRKAYMRDLMREKRAKAKKAKEDK